MIYALRLPRSVRMANARVLIVCLALAFALFADATTKHTIEGEWVETFESNTYNVFCVLSK